MRGSTLLRSTLISTLCVCVVASPALADGFMVAQYNPQAAWERDYVTEVDQKAAIFYSGNTETVVISPSFQGDAASFAWVVPVPSRPQVSIVQGALFHELAAIGYRDLPHQEAAEEMSAGARQQTMSVTVIERETVGAYDVSVLDADVPLALYGWLRANGYSVPNAISAPLSYYIDHHWTFVASRVKVPQDARGLATGTLAPLKLTFTTSHPVYPMRLSSANADPFSVLVYLIRPMDETSMAARDADKLAAPVGHTDPTTMLADLHADPDSYPTLADLQSGTMAIYVERGMFDPADCKADFIWETPVALAYAWILWGALSAVGCGGLALVAFRARNIREHLARPWR